MVLAGSWLSGFFIVATDGWMQHPTGYLLGADGEIRLEILGLAAESVGRWQYLHTMLGAVVTGSFFMASIGAFYLVASGTQVWPHLRRWV